MTKPAATEADKHIAKRAQMLRVSKEITASKAAEALGLNQQQMSRYELGQNKMTAALVHRMAQFYDVPVSWFFLDLPITVDRAGQDSGYISTDEKEELDILRKRWGKLNAIQRSTILKLLDSYL